MFVENAAEFRVRRQFTLDVGQDHRLAGTCKICHQRHDAAAGLLGTRASEDDRVFRFVVDGDDLILHAERKTGCRYLLCAKHRGREHLADSLARRELSVGLRESIFSPVVFVTVIVHMRFPLSSADPCGFHQRLR